MRGGGGAGEKEWSLRPLSGKEGERRREGGKNEKKRREAPFFDLSPSLVSLSLRSIEKRISRGKYCDLNKSKALGADLSRPLPLVARGRAAVVVVVVVVVVAAVARRASFFRARAGVGKERHQPRQRLPDAARHGEVDEHPRLPEHVLERGGLPLVDAQPVPDRGRVVVGPHLHERLAPSGRRHRRHDDGGLAGGRAGREHDVRDVVPLPALPADSPPQALVDKDLLSQGQVQGERHARDGAEEGRGLGRRPREAVEDKGFPVRLGGGRAAAAALQEPGPDEVGDEGVWDEVASVDGGGDLIRSGKKRRTREGSGKRERNEVEVERVLPFFFRYDERRCSMIDG